MKITKQDLHEVAEIIEAMRNYHDPKLGKIIGSAIMVASDNAYNLGFKDGCDFEKNRQTA